MLLLLAYREFQGTNSPNHCNDAPGDMGAPREHTHACPIITGVVAMRHTAILCVMKTK